MGVKLAAVKELLQVCHNQMVILSQSSKTKQGRAAKGGDACGAQQLGHGTVMLIFPLESKGKHVVEFHFQVFHPFLKRVLEMNPILIDN